MGTLNDKLIRDFDLYLSSLRHISDVGMNTIEFNKAIKSLGYDETIDFIEGEIKSSQDKIIEDLINSQLSNKVGFSNVVKMREFIMYPDFHVRTYVKNVANLFRNTNSISKSVIVSSVEELNLVTRSTKSTQREADVVRIKRLNLSPNVMVFCIKKDMVDNYYLEGGTKTFGDKFKEKYGATPSKDDLIAIRSILIKYMIENLRTDKRNGIDVFYDRDAIISYNYQDMKKQIGDNYDVDWVDSYTSRSSITSPWINRGVVFFDNREIVLESINPAIVPLELQRIKK